MTLLAGPWDVGQASVLTARHKSRQRRSSVFGYLFPIVLAVSATLAWFAPGGFIAGGDVAPYVRNNLPRELWSVWNHQTTGAGSASYSSAQALDVFLLRGTHFLGLSPIVAQHLLFALCFGWAAFGSAFLAGVWVRRPFAIAAAGLFGAFNTYLLVNQPNVLPPLAIGLIGTFVGVVLRAARPGSKVTVPKLAAVLVTTLAFSYLVQNPPLLALSLLAIASAAVAATPLVGRGATRRAVLLSATVGAGALVINLWWIVPASITIFGAGTGSSFTAQTDVAAWAWTQARASLGAVATLNGHWGWNQPEYYPYAHAMDGGIWPALSWLLPLLALVGAVVADRSQRVVAWILASCCIVLLFLAKGVHPPLGALNLWLFEHVPGMWLFRDPMSKFGTLLVLLYAILAAIAIEGVPRLLEKRLGKPSARLGHGFLGLALAGALAFPWPLWTGAVIPTSRGALPGEHVTIPDGWYQVASVVNGTQAAGKVLILPLDPYYQISTTWNYHGVDAIPAQLLHKPALQLLPGGYFSGTPGFNALLENVQSSLLGTHPSSAMGELRALGVSEIIVRHDLRPSADLPPAPDPKQIESGLRSLIGVDLLSQSVVASVYRVADSASAGRVVPTLVGLRAVDSSSVAEGIGHLSKTQVATTDPTAVVDAVSWQISGARGDETVTVAKPGTYQVTVESGEALYTPEAVPEANLLTLKDASPVDLDGSPLPRRPDLFVPLTGTATAVSVNGITQPLGHYVSPVAIGHATTVTAYGPMPDAANPLGRFSELGNCDGTESARTESNSLRQSEDGTVELVSYDGSACIQAPVAKSPGVALFSVNLKYRVLGGDTARICLWEGSRERCAPMPSLSSGSGWRTYSGLAKVDLGAADLHLYLYADNSEVGEPTTVEYSGITVTPLQQVGSALLDGGDGLADSAMRYLNAGSHTLAFGADGSGGPAASFSALQDCDRHNSASDTAHLAAVTEEDGYVELHAQADSACVWSPAAVGGLSSVYAVALDYRTISGRPARVCVWQVGPNRCAPLPSLETSPGWHHLSASVRPQKDTREIDVYLYADGQSSPQTITAYRNVKVTPDSALSINIRQASPATVAPHATWLTTSPAQYDVRIDHASGSFVVTIPESYAAGWKLSGVPAGWSARHIEVDGYANGWVVVGHGSADLTLAFGPQRLTKFGQWLSLVALVMVGLGVSFLKVRALIRSRAARVRDV